jgi:hypothetical protein
MIEKTINLDLEPVNNLSGSFFTGVDDQVNLYYDPIVTGYAFIYWVDLPFWFKEDKDLAYFKSFTEKNFRSFSGISPIELQTATHQTGFAGHEMNVVTGVQRNNTDFQISHKEFSGSPMTKMYQKWISMIRDPRTNLALYPKLYNCEYGARNHSGQLLYIMTRPDATNAGHNVVEYAAFYSNVVPTNVPLDTLYNFSIGDQDSPTIEISFKGFPEIGPHVNEYAERILRDKIMSSTGDSFIPFVDSYNAGTIDATKTPDKAESKKLFTGADLTSNLVWSSGSDAMNDIYVTSEE